MCVTSDLLLSLALQGAAAAVIFVSLWNCPQRDAFEHEKYGDVITVERRIPHTGGATYSVLDSRGVPTAKHSPVSYQTSLLYKKRARKGAEKASLVVIVAADAVVVAVVMIVVLSAQIPLCGLSSGLRVAQPPCCQGCLWWRTGEFWKTIVCTWRWYTSQNECVQCGVVLSFLIVFLFVAKYVPGLFLLAVECELDNQSLFLLLLE